MDKNSVLGLVLIFVILIGFSWWMTPSKEDREARQKQQDSLYRVEKQRIDSVKVLESKRLAVSDTLSDSVPMPVISPASPAGILRELYGSFTNAASGSDQAYLLENDKVRITVNRRGGGIRRIELKDYKSFDQRPLILYEGDTALTSFTFFSDNRDLNTKALYFQPVYGELQDQEVPQALSVSGSDSLQFLMRLYPDASDSSFDKTRYIEFRYTLRGDEYMTGFAISFHGMKEVLAANMNYINLDMRMDLIQQEKGLDNEKNTSTIYYKFLNDEVDYLSGTKYQNKSLKTKVKWVSFKQQFFCTTLIADESFGTAEIATFHTGDTNRYLKSAMASIDIPLNLDAGESVIAMQLYTGPNKYKTFRKYKLDLERQIPLGWSFFLMAWINKYAVIPVFDFLSGFNLNYGIIILILTILLKIVLFPIAYKTYLSSARMRVLKPEVEELAKKFPKKEDALKKQQATMDLYKRAGINPMAGCVPMLLQLPILIAMFRFFPASIELRQQPFLWASDLSSYDSILDLPFSIPFYGDHVSLFTLLMTISTIIYTRISNEMMSSGSQQLPGMKTMMYIMPVLFLGFFNNYSSGLSYYYLLANLLTFLQMFLIRRVVDEDKIHARIQENRKKPVKKSNFQKRLEEMATKKGYQTRR